MVDVGIYTLVVLAGWSLGLFFFGGLWWTVGKLVRSRTPAHWMIASTLVRTGVTLLGGALFFGRLLAADARLPFGLPGRKTERLLVDAFLRDPPAGRIRACDSVLTRSFSGSTAS